MRRSVPATSSAYPVAGVAKETSITSSDVDTPTSDHVLPPSSDRASAPAVPVANATEDERARTRENVASSCLPIGLQFAPVSSESTMVPPSPAATALVGEVKAAARIFWVEGVTDDQVVPPSSVRITVWPLVVMTQASVVPQRMRRSPGSSP